MSDILKSLVGRTIAVWSGEGATSYQDRGVLEAVDGQVVLLRHKDGEHLVFTICNIRLIKVIQ
jgi:hypothetical protein